MTIDAHTHLGSLGDQTFEPDQLIFGMDKAGITHSLIFSGLPDLFGFSNDQAIEISQANPRLKAIGHVDITTFNQEQIDNLCRLLEQKLIFGIKFYLGYQDYMPDDPRFDPLYTFCQSNGYPVLYHTGLLLAGYQGFLKQAHPLNIDTIATRYPQLKIVICHLGNPWVVDSIAVMLKNPNVYADLSGFFEEYVPIKQSEIEFFHERLRLVKVFMGGLHKCIFGTDWPLYDHSEYLEAVQSFPMSDEERELVLWKNANQVFNLGL
jgi:uncharacterized protein